MCDSGWIRGLALLAILALGFARPAGAAKPFNDPPNCRQSLRSLNMFKSENLGPKGREFKRKEPVTAFLMSVTSQPTTTIFGSTLVTTECLDDALAAARQRDEFVAAMELPLLHEAAAGRGERLSALARLFGCPRAADGRFGALAQGTLAGAPPADATPDSAAWLRRLTGAVRADPRLAAACRAA